MLELAFELEFKKYVQKDVMGKKKELSTKILFAFCIAYFEHTQTCESVRQKYKHGTALTAEFTPQLQNHSGPSSSNCFIF